MGGAEVIMHIKSDKRFSKKKLILILIILVILSGLTMVLKDPDYVFYTTYCKNYYSIIANTWSYYKYDQIIEVNGEPDKTVREKIQSTVIILFILNMMTDGYLFFRRMRIRIV